MACDHIIGLEYDWDSAKALHYKDADAWGVRSASSDGYAYCPLCGEKLNWERMLARANRTIEQRERQRAEAIARRMKVDAENRERLVKLLETDKNLAPDIRAGITLFLHRGG
jgi:hypothetical protein